MAAAERDDTDELGEIERVLSRLDAAARAITRDQNIGDAITVELVVDSGDHRDCWFVRLDADGGRAARGPASDPTVVVRIDDDTYRALRSGALDVPRAIDGGRLTVRGDLGALARARPALRALADALAGRDNGAGS